MEESELDEGTPGTAIAPQDETSFVDDSVEVAEESLVNAQNTTGMASQEALQKHEGPEGLLRDSGETTTSLEDCTGRMEAFQINICPDCKSELDLSKHTFCFCCGKKIEGNILRMEHLEGDSLPVTQVPGSSEVEAETNKVVVVATHIEHTKQNVEHGLVGPYSRDAESRKQKAPGDNVAVHYNATEHVRKTGESGRQDDVEKNDKTHGSCGNIRETEILVEQRKPDGGAQAKSVGAQAKSVGETDTGEIENNKGTKQSVRANVSDVDKIEQQDGGECGMKIKIPNQKAKSKESPEVGETRHLDGESHIRPKESTAKDTQVLPAQSMPVSHDSRTHANQFVDKTELTADESSEESKEVQLQSKVETNADTEQTRNNHSQSKPGPIGSNAETNNRSEKTDTQSQKPNGKDQLAPNGKDQLNKDLDSQSRPGPTASNAETNKLGENSGSGKKTTLLEQSFSDPLFRGDQSAGANSPNGHFYMKEEYSGNESRRGNANKNETAKHTTRAQGCYEDESVTVVFHAILFPKFNTGGDMHIYIRGENPIFCGWNKNAVELHQKKSPNNKNILLSGQIKVPLIHKSRKVAYKYVVVVNGKSHYEELFEFTSFWGTGYTNRYLVMPTEFAVGKGKISISQFCK